MLTVAMSQPGSGQVMTLVSSSRLISRSTRSMSRWRMASLITGSSSPAGEAGKQITSAEDYDKVNAGNVTQKYVRTVTEVGFENEADRHLEKVVEH